MTFKSMGLAAAAVLLISGVAHAESTLGTNLQTYKTVSEEAVSTKVSEATASTNEKVEIYSEDIFAIDPTTSFGPR